MRNPTKTIEAFPGNLGTKAGKISGKTTAERLKNMRDKDWRDRDLPWGREKLSSHHERWRDIDHDHLEGTSKDRGRGRYMTDYQLPRHGKGQGGSREQFRKTPSRKEVDKPKEREGAREESNREVW